MFPLCKSEWWDPNISSQFLNSICESTNDEYYSNYWTKIRLSLTCILLMSFVLICVWIHTSWFVSTSLSASDEFRSMIKYDFLKIDNICYWSCDSICFRASSNLTASIITKIFWSKLCWWSVIFANHDIFRTIQNYFCIALVCVWSLVVSDSTVGERSEHVVGKKKNSGISSTSCAERRGSDCGLDNCHQYFSLEVAPKE